MAEIRQSFSSADGWQNWRQEFGEIESVRLDILNDIRVLGYVEPLTGIARRPPQIAISDEDLQESISSNNLNSRKRAFLLQIMLELETRNWLSRRDLRILGAEAVSRIAMIFRGRFPYYLGTEYLPDQASRREYFPVPHMDLQQIECPNESFDVFISGDVFEPVTDLDTAFKEIHRVIKPGGIFISSFLFQPRRLKSLGKASLSHKGEITHHAEPKYHVSPIADEKGSLVFQLPGWDFLPKLLDWGFEDAYFSMIASSHFGILSDAQLGVFILTASKLAAGGDVRRRPTNVVAKLALPEKLCTLIALPRSGTTMLTSVFAVHSKCEAVYEPWNGKRIFGDAESRIEVIAMVEKLPNLSGKMLFVKETSAFQGSIPGLRKLYESAPFPVEKHMLMLLRRPEHTFLSEIERRKEWWKDDVSVNAETFTGWAEKSALALRLMLDFGIASAGTIVLLEDFAERPAELIGQLAQRIGFAVERQQLEYEKHLDRSRVRGDLNVGQNPSKISTSAVLSRTEKIGGVGELVRGSPHVKWFAALQLLYEFIHSKGGILSIREIPKPVIAALQ